LDPQRLVPRPVERGAVVAEFLPQRLLGLGIGEVGRWRDGAFPLLLQARRSVIRSWENRARRRGLGAVRRAPRHHTAIIPHHERPPPGARGLVREGSPTGPIRATECRRPGPPPPPHDCH
jgi:hypothetical protein